MAKRRKINAPSGDQLRSMEERFSRETPSPAASAMAPISRVAAEDAARVDPLPEDQRLMQVQDLADAKAWRTARDDGRIIDMVPLDDIADDALIRDRTVLDPDDMAELTASIQSSGLRLPIEVFRSPDAASGRPFALLSGFRRLKAFRDLRAQNPSGAFQTIPAVIRDPDTLGGAFAAMVEENEIRANLSHFERGRIVVLAAREGAFSSVEDAVDALFRVASKAKRSKIRSFALIFESLGEDLLFPAALREKDGLRLAVALRNGDGGAIRGALRAAAPTSPEDEWAAIESALSRITQDVEAARRRGGRPRAPSPTELSGIPSSHLPGVTLETARKGDGFAIHISGPGATQDRVRMAVSQLVAFFRDQTLE